MSRLDDIKNFYETLDLTKVKNKKNIQNELLYQLYKKPVEKIAPKYSNVLKNELHMADLLFLPDDEGYKYALVVVDVGSRLCDAEPIKNKYSKTVLDAILKIYKRKILTYPYKIKVDSGTEFQSVFKSFFIKNNVDIITAQPARHRQIALAEARNKQIVSYLFKRMTAQELKTGEKSVEWVKWLPKIVKILNNRMERKNLKRNNSSKFWEDENMLDVGDSVRYKLDRPIDVVTGKPLNGKFRESDIKFSLVPTKIKLIHLSSDNPPLYALEGKHAYYTR